MKLDGGGVLVACSGSVGLREVVVDNQWLTRLMVIVLHIVEAVLKVGEGQEGTEG